MNSLRHLGYDNYSAIADLVDNCIDAGAKTIKILARVRDGQPDIFIADDGIGMDRVILDQAIRLGSLVEKDSASDLGRFRMGLCTASLSICRETTVLTKAQDEPILKAVNDVDEIKRQNEFVSFFGEPSDEDRQLLSDLLGETASGTVVILRKCDNLQNKSSMSVFANTLRTKLGRIFRYFISADCAIFVNDKRLGAIDPLMWDDTRTERFDDNTLKVRISDEGTEIEDEVRIKLAILPEHPAEGEKAGEYGITNQGFYILRNNREILDSVTLDLFLKHGEFNRFRGEIHFSGTLDKYMTVNFTKRNVTPWQSLFDQLSKYLLGQLKTIRGRCKRAQRAETPEHVKEVHEDVEREIRKKSKLLLVPKAPKEIRESPTDRNGKGKNSSREPMYTREPREKQQPGGFAANCEFLTATLGEAGPIFEGEQKGRKIIVKWNSDHPFYKRFLLDNSQDRSMAAAADFLVYSWDCAELMWFSNNDDTLQLITNFKSVVSANMRTLLS
ncbi:MAG: ATP-binding protein [Gemmataceae bacterium]